MVARTGSGYTRVRHVLVQRHSGADRSSTLAKFLKNRKHRALILYLLLLTGWEPARKPHRSEVWLRALQVDQGKRTWSKSSVSQAWSDLVSMELVERTRENRLARVIPRREDANGEYFHPDGKTPINYYFHLPGEFWTEDYFDSLSLPALFVLLIILKETNEKAEVHLTYEQTADWYGMSPSSAKKGYLELRAAGLLNVREESETAPLATHGVTQHFYYSLSGPFSTKSREAARKKAKAEADARKTSTTKTKRSGSAASRKTSK